jgi:hypothetical protein
MIVQNKSRKSLHSRLSSLRLRAALAIAGALVLAAMPFAVHADATGTQRPAIREHAILDFKIVIPPVLKVTPLTAPRRLVIEQTDIERGYVDLHEASSLAIATNSRHGFMLSAQIDSTLLERAEVHVANQTLRAASDLSSMLVQLPQRSHSSIGVSYRLHLKQQTRAGEYRWPVALTFSLQTI